MNREMLTARTVKQSANRDVAIFKNALNSGKGYLFAKAIEHETSN